MAPQGPQAGAFLSHLSWIMKLPLRELQGPQLPTSVGVRWGVFSQLLTHQVPWAEPCGPQSPEQMPPPPASPPRRSGPPPSGHKSLSRHRPPLPHISLMHVATASALDGTLGFSTRFLWKSTSELPDEGCFEVRTLVDHLCTYPGHITNLSLVHLKLALLSWFLLFLGLQTRLQDVPLGGMG